MKECKATVCASKAGLSTRIYIADRPKAVFVLNSVSYIHLYRICLLYLYFVMSSACYILVACVGKDIYIINVHVTGGAGLYLKHS